MYFSTVPKGYRMLRQPDMMVQFYFRNLEKFVLSKCLKRNVYLDRAKKSGKAVGRTFLSNEQFNTAIQQKIASGEPFFCCRYGATEITTCFYARIRQGKILDSLDRTMLRRLKTSSGVFPESEDMYLIFADSYMQALTEADMNAYWGSVLMEEYLIDRIMKKECTQYAMRALEPFQYEVPWTQALKGRKVLVVHPFKELIQQQYERRKEIFPDKEILPDFDLKVVKAIQSSGDTTPEDYQNWSEALDALYNQCMKSDFQVALLSCGSYAVPLAARLKAAGKQAIVVGGMLQLMFGIKGARWEASRPDIVAMYNDAWVRAGGNYRVKNADKMVDGAAYW